MNDTSESELAQFVDQYEDTVFGKFKKRINSNNKQVHNFYDLF